MDGREENNARMGQNHFMAQNMQNYCRANARGIFLLFFFANFHFLLAGRETYLTPPTPSESTANAPTNRNPETHERKPRPPISESHDQCEGDSPNACPAGQSCVNHLCQCAQGSVFLNGKCQIVAACKADPECDKNAICIINLFGKNTCQCKPGYIDVDIITPGRECAKDHAFQEDYSTPVVMVVEQKTPNGTRCGDNYCQDELNEVCVGGSQCKCRPGYGRANPGDKCEPMEKTPLTFRVVTVGNKPLTFSSTEYGTSGSPSYVEFAKEFTNDLGKAVGTTEYAPRYLTTDINYITHPKTVNSSWPDGLLVNFTVGTRPGDKPVDACDLWKQLMESIQKTNGQIGGGRQQVATDIELLSPCPKEQGPLCGGKVCRPELGEFCIGDEICGCPEGQKRAGPDDHCRVVESWTFPLWVIRKNQYTIDYNDTFANPADTLYRQYIQSLENGIHQSYLQTPLRNSFVTSEVIDLMNPNLMNGTWEHGVLFNTTMYFRVGTVPKAQDTYNQLIRWIIDRNNYQVGQSGLYLNPYQPNPFGACYKNDCHREAICYETGKNSYRCECPAGFRDMLPSFPGHACLATKDINECENATLNDCSTNARCIDLEYLYRCANTVHFTMSGTSGSSFHYDEVVVVAEDEWKLHCPNDCASTKFTGHLGDFNWECTFDKQYILTVECIELKQKTFTESVQLEIFIYAKNRETEEYSLWNKHSVYSSSTFVNPQRITMAPESSSWSREHIFYGRSCHGYLDRKQYIALTVRILKDRRLFHSFTVDTPIEHLENNVKLQVGHQIFHVNKEMLASISPFFNTMFRGQNNFVEARQEIIHLGGRKDAPFPDLLLLNATLFHDFLLAIVPFGKYTVLPNSKNIAGLLHLAEYYQIKSATEKFQSSLKLCREMPMTTRVILAKQYGTKELHASIMYSVDSLEECKRLCVALMQK